MLQRSTEPHKKQVAAILSAAPLKPASDRLADFTKHYYANAALYDLQNQSPTALATLAKQHYEYAQVRRADKTLFDIEPTDAGFTFFFVSEDKPFLIDSLSMLLMRFGLTLTWTLHPHFLVKRDGTGKLKAIKPHHGNPDKTYIKEAFICFSAEGKLSKAQLKQLNTTLRTTLDDIRLATDDWQAMRKQLSTASAALSKQTLASKRSLEETQAFLTWLADDHFTFLGYRYYKFIENGHVVLRAKPDSALGALKSRPSTSLKRKMDAQTEALQKQAHNKTLLTITKANIKATVHRDAYLDYIGVKAFNEKGDVVGEHRFLGLFTSAAYSRSPKDIPLLRQKVQKVTERFGLEPKSHAAKTLEHVLSTFPRDELFQMSVSDLERTAEGVLNLQERSRAKLFLRRDTYHRFYSALIYVPKDKYNTQVRKKIERLLADALNAHETDSNVDISQSNLARLHTIARVDPAKPIKANARQLEKAIQQAILTWDDRLAAECTSQANLPEFSAAYQEDIAPKAAAVDVARINQLLKHEASLDLYLYRQAPHLSKQQIGLRTFHQQTALPLHQALPIFASMGFKVINERPYATQINEQTIWIQDFTIEVTCQTRIDDQAIQANFLDCLNQALQNRIDIDQFNSLVVTHNRGWQAIRILRCYAHYLRQIPGTPSKAYIESIFVKHAKLADALIELFLTQFAPGVQQRDAAITQIKRKIKKHLKQVSQADEDRAITRFYELIKATNRTNYFQLGPNKSTKSYLSIKLDPSGIADLPEPKPAHEIFVYAKHVEGVHLRGGDIARGGLRWSDRREDYRTEVLGLMKAQMVKNTLIVPVGAKGGFVCKQLPTDGDRDAWFKEGTRCYQDFIRGLLDVTDNIKNGKTLAPKKVVRRDRSDPYFVVAADKGTATFSDTANGVASDYDFWLGDAFASGGSAGYDHKKMGITAKGGWEAVKRHFLEMGINPQKQDFTVMGIGDMSGDVFGNGMLCSKHIRLQAAFNHMHIFIDPNPDATSAFKERQRLFKLPRSSWADYDAKLISAGGGVFSRQEKSIKLSKPAKALLHLNQASATPDEIIRAILMAPTDLLWNGGIGTYVKASSETHAQVGDRTNNRVRVNGEDLQCKVIGEGGNLGMTQLGRVEYALQGGRLNTDFVDNSGGVDCSDHEVNIKILLNEAMQKGKLSLKKRNELLASMTKAIEHLVLRNNFIHTQAISTIQMQSADRIREYANLIRWLEKSVGLNRAIEFLPDDEQVEERIRKHQGLTRPELAVLMAYAKMDLYQSLLTSKLPDDEYFGTELPRYFPEALQKPYGKAMQSHSLKREIIATQITNSLVHRMGPAFVKRTCEELDVSADQVARAYAVMREVFDARTLWQQIEKLGPKVSLQQQYALYAKLAKTLRRASHWLLAKANGPIDIQYWIDALQNHVTRVLDQLPNWISEQDNMRLAQYQARWTDQGIPKPLALRFAKLGFHHAALDIGWTAKQQACQADTIAKPYFAFGQMLNLPWIYQHIEGLQAKDRWHAQARIQLRKQLYAWQIKQTQACAKKKHSAADWVNQRSEAVTAWQQQQLELGTAATPDYATLAVIVENLNAL